jgi:FMN phosphatase YigB (HAD superfamily)
MNTENPYKQVVFDFGGVLIEWAPQKIAKLYSTDKSVQKRVLDDVIQHPEWSELDAGSCTEAEMAKRMASRSAFSEAEIHTIFDTVRGSYTAIPEGVQALNKFASLNIPCYGLSNISVENYRYLRNAHDFFGLLKGEFISGEEKVSKPNEAIFKRFCDKFGVLPQDTLFIDDKWDNCIAAEQAGFHSFHFERGLKDITYFIS